MKKSQAINSGNSDNSVSCFMPLHNALGIKNWPQHVQDECKRVPENDKDRKFIPFEDFIVAGLNGEPLTSAWDLIGEKNVLRQRDEVILAALNYEYESDLDDKSADDFLAAVEKQADLIERIGAEDDPLDIEENNMAYYRDMYPWLFERKTIRDIIYSHGSGTGVIFHGTSRTEVVSGRKRKFRQNWRDWRTANGRRAHFNTKTKRYKNRRTVTFRSMHLDILIAEAERIAEAEMVF